MEICSIVCFFHIHSFNIKSIVADYKTGFGGQFGVQKDRQDKSAVGWEDRGELSKHESQKGQ